MSSRTGCEVKKKKKRKYIVIYLVGIKHLFVQFFFRFFIFVILIKQNCAVTVKHVGATASVTRRKGSFGYADRREQEVVEHAETVIITGCKLNSSFTGHIRLKGSCFTSSFATFEYVIYGLDIFRKGCCIF